MPFKQGIAPAEGMPDKSMNAQKRRGCLMDKERIIVYSDFTTERDEWE